ncbi:N,N-dimethylformamidase beta subunit family domain-containing protein [Conexibacter sp. SYSU D00693]|uniref:N,N-dimethylformamidase beta subunit family domain-containing protein n=1 Tax=Conexibacter sp. SYSU D00693 TaxID=2812560 RepID=UPI00196B47B2|nr:N,N-dimethylformamidase beta subunit family domain-containing protein [Conexibacter sp. SYSU D00693]
MNLARRIAFLTLVAATFAAFFVAQRLKNAPSVVQYVRFSGVLSPNSDGRKDTVRLNFLVKEADDVTVEVVDADGDLVRTLVEDLPRPAYRAFDDPLRWDGRDDDGEPVPDGRYRLRIVLQGQGRTIVPQRSVRVDRTPPAPRVTSISPDRVYGPELLPKPDGGPAVVRFGPALERARVMVFKTAPGRPRLVLERRLAPGTTSWSWTGELDGGRRASGGTYVAVLEWRDEAENIGTSIPLGRDGLPRVPANGRPWPGRGGITVRNLGVQGPSAPVRAGERAVFGIDARQARYSWRLRRVGSPTVYKRGSGTRAQFGVTVPADVASGVFLLEVRTRRHATATPFLVEDARPRPVLAVLPWTTWQGRNGADDDGDGLPDALDLGRPARTQRMVVGAGGLPAGFATHEAPVLAWLDRTGRRYDVTTDLALEHGVGPRLAGHRGVLLPGDTRWLTPRVRRDLRTFVRRGGALASFGTDSLLRTVRLRQGRRERLADPGPRGRADLFGARLRPVVRRPVDLEVSGQPDAVQLFAGTDGRFPGVPAWEETASLGPQLRHAASAVTVDPPGREVVVAARFGRGLVVRPGLPDLGVRLTPDPALQALVARTWTLLSR